MNQTKQQQQTATDDGGPPLVVGVPSDHVSLTLVDENGEAVHESAGRSCGTRRLRAVGVNAAKDDEARTVLTERCYDVPPGADVTLRISPRSAKQPSAASGTVFIETSRGRLSATRVEFDGTAEYVDVGFGAPDETIKVSVRAFLEGHQRGKVHLHIEPTEE